MRPLSFRAKIALLSLVFSGLLVVGFGMFFLATIQHLGMERIDREIRVLAEGQLIGRFPADHWRDFDRSLRFVYGDESSSLPAVRVQAAAGHVVFESSDLAPEISELADALALSQTPPTRGEGDFVERLDRDGDNLVSREEFDGPAVEFDRFDENGDGGITIEEASRARAVLGHRPEPPVSGFRAEPSRHPPARFRELIFRTVQTSKGPWRVGVLANEHVTLTLGLDLADFAREAERFRRAFLIALPIALLSLATGGWLLARRALAPLTLLTATAERITAHGLDERIPETDVDPEMRRLIEVINGMLERLERSFGQANRFSADAAHELQSPLAVLQGELENQIQSSAPGSDQQLVFAGLMEEVRRLTAVVRKLLLLSRADAGRLTLHREPLSLDRLLEEAIEDVEAMNPELEIECDLEPGITLDADPDLLGQLLRNLSTNAVNHNRSARQGGRVRFESRSTDTNLSLRVSNTADPISEADRKRLFDRFFRVDESRTRQAGGSGLGLSLAREIARAHGGDLGLGPYRDGMVTLELSLPLPPRIAT